MVACDGHKRHRKVVAIENKGNVAAGLIAGGEEIVAAITGGH